MSGKRIQNDQEYEKSLKWLRELAGKLADPLLSGPDDILDGKPVSYWKRAYDLVSDQVRAYRRGELAKEFPGLRRVYAELGWTYYEPEETPQETAPELQTEAEEPEVEQKHHEPEAPPVQPPATPKKKDIWADD